MEKNIKKSVTEEVNERIMSIKSKIIDALNKENLKLKNRAIKLELQFLELCQKSNSFDQHKRSNNLENQGISANIVDEKLE